MIANILKYLLYTRWGCLRAFHLDPRTTLYVSAIIMTLFGRWET